MATITRRDVSAWIERFMTVVTLAVAAAIAGKYVVSPVFKASSEAPRAIPVPVEPLRVHGASEGSREAPVVVLEFSDFECPFCGRFVRNSLPELRTKYVESGKVRFVFNHFPLEAIHPLAFKAAVAAECGRRQGAFWTLHDAMFANQETLQDLVTNPGRSVRLDRRKVSECLGSQDAMQAVRADMDLAEKLHLTGTPAFFIGTAVSPDAVKVQQVLRGALTAATLGDAIDALLPKH